MTIAHAREVEVLDAAARGLTVRETGAELFLSVDTIKTYRRRVLRRTGARNMAQAVDLWTTHPDRTEPPHLDPLAAGEAGG